MGTLENGQTHKFLSGIEGLNQGFRKIAGTPSDGEGVDTFIQFELAKRTPNNEPTNGIVRVNGNSVPGYAEEGISNDGALGHDAAPQRDIKALTTWYGDDYINIFVVPEINGNDGGHGTQGFAFLGPTGDERDGVVILYNAFGLEGELKSGRTLNHTITHEVGHHLSLSHTFSNSNSCEEENNCNSSGDQICDTPVTLANTSCTVPSCENSQVENFMDYAPETCKNMFTEGQRNRMRAMLETSRSSLLESLGAQPVVDNDLTVLGLSYPGDTTCVGNVLAEVRVQIRHPGS